MRDTTEILANAVFQALNGNVTYNGDNVPIYDEKKKIRATDSLYGLFSTQQEIFNPDSMQGVFENESTLDIELVHATSSEVSKTVLSRVANSILEILFPTPNTVGINQPSGFQIQSFEYAGSLTKTFDTTPTQSIVRKFIKLKAKIIQQS